MTYDQSRLKEKLNELINQHSELDDAIAVSYTHLRAHRDATLSRMPSSA